MIIPQQDTYKHKGLRRTLVETIQSKGIHDEAVLAAIGRVPRHFFFDPALLSHAYEDKAFPIGEGQTISQPYTVAFQTELLQVKKGDRVLEVGTGSGYQACVLIELGCKVYTIEYNKVLYDRVRRFLPAIGYEPKFFHGDGSLGIPELAPYDAIIVTAGAPVVPKSLIEQLAIGGRLVIPVGDRKTQKMLCLTKKGENKLEKEEFHHFSFVPLLGDEGWKA
jgi:protein-L-isoaspartate(D-aspartate) O-methyltransferase